MSEKWEKECTADKVNVGWRSTLLRWIKCQCPKHKGITVEFVKEYYGYDFSNWERKRGG